jgi:hypothetical protein
MKVEVTQTQEHKLVYNIISQFLINKICFAKLMDSIIVHLKNQNVIQHNWKKSLEIIF